MKIIGQMAFWLMDKFIYQLIGRKGFTPAPVPDGWPPDGSMHFLCFDHPIGTVRHPLNAVQYEFGANVGEDDPMVFVLGQEIISRLCESRKTLITFSFDSELQKRKYKKGSAISSQNVIQFLRFLVPETYIAQKRNMAAFFSAGCPKGLFSQYQAASNIPNCFIDFYLFSEETVPLCLEDGLSLIEHGDYQVNLYLGYGPNALNIVFNSKSLDSAGVKKVVEDVCNGHNILLMNPR